MNDHQKKLKTKKDLKLSASLFSMYLVLFVIIAIAVLIDENDVESTVYYSTLTIIVILILIDIFIIYRIYKTRTMEALLKQKAIKKYDERTRHLASKANAGTLISIVALLPFVMIYAIHINSIQLLFYSFSMLVIVTLIRFIVGLFYKYKN